MWVCGTSCSCQSCLALCSRGCMQPFLYIALLLSVAYSKLLFFVLLNFACGRASLFVDCDVCCCCVQVARSQFVYFVLLLFITYLTLLYPCVSEFSCADGQVSSLLSVSFFFCCCCVQVPIVYTALLLLLRI